MTAPAKTTEFHATPRVEKGTIEPNPINLSEDAVHALVPELDAHLASLFVMFHQYQKHHWLVEGPSFMEIHEQLEAYYDEVHEDLDAIAERMTALGGIPTSAPMEQAMLAYISHEPEGIFSMRDMLKRDRFYEGLIAERLRATITVAQQHEDYGTSHLLEEVLEHCEERAHHLDHYLGEDTLYKE
ncbi:MAG: DNA starvation/stationary phase protection protein [Chloroflexi bacterium]|nr:DNA starvation/stationary phase protection protein [Chloroflexota bacterium]